MADTASPPPITPRIDFAQALAGAFGLDGQVAFVPGGYGGIGEAIAWGLALAGARAGDRRARASRRPRRSPRACAPPAIARSTPSMDDAAEVDSLRAAVDDAARRIGGSTCSSTASASSASSASPRSARRRSTRCIAGQPEGGDVPGAGRARATRSPRGRGGGRRCTCCRCARSSALRGRGYSAYCATKGALVMLISSTRSSSRRTASRQRRGADRGATEMARALARRTETTRAADRSSASRSAASREPRDVAAPVVFFCAPGGVFVTGQILYVDGGITATQ